MSGLATVQANLGFMPCASLRTARRRKVELKRWINIPFVKIHSEAETGCQCEMLPLLDWDINPWIIPTLGGSFSRRYVFNFPGDA